MISFYIDTSSDFLYTGIASDNTLLISRNLKLSHDLSVFALDEISKMFREVNLEPSDIEKIIVVNGPGSFTGIRIGVTIAKILSWSLNKDIIVISSLEAMATSFVSNSIIVPIINARRGCCYVAVYDNNEIILKDQYMNIEELLLFLKSRDKEYIFISNDKFDNINCYDYHPDILRIVNKYKNRPSLDAHFVNPTYLKLTEAEETRTKEV